MRERQQTVTAFIVGVGFLWASTVWAAPGGLPKCQRDLATCNADLAHCQTDLGAQPNVVCPGDGTSGPTLSYTNGVVLPDGRVLGDGTATDNNSLLMWEVKDNTAGIHGVGNIYAWSNSGTAADGSLFTVFLDTLNNKCDGDEATACTSNAACTGIGNDLCGHAGYRDWRIPNVKELQSIVDYGHFNPAIDPTFPGLTAPSFYWSSTTGAICCVGGAPPPGNIGADFGADFAWFVDFQFGSVEFDDKDTLNLVRAVRGGS